MEGPPADPSGGGGAAAAAAEGPTVQVADMRRPSGALPLRLLEWKVKPGSRVNVNSVLALCALITQDKDKETEAEASLPEKKVKSDRPGVVRELCCQPGQIIPPGGVIVRIEECSHPIVMKCLCAECGQNLTQQQGTATVSMVHSVPELMVSSEQAKQLAREDQQRLHRNKKLVLMVDLDQTLIHTTEHHCQRMSNKGIFHFQLGRGEPMLHTRLRPHCKEFLEKIAKLYELHVFTFGSRLYAHTIAGFLDPEKKLFSHRILSRDECIDPSSKTGNLRNLFPCGDSMVCIIDDREDVWKFAPNLITVKKYIYFQGIGDINAPPGSREAQMAKKGGPSSRPAESTDQAEAIGADEQNNGLRKRSKEPGISGKEELSLPQSSQEGAAGERTLGAVEEDLEEAGRSQGSDAGHKVTESGQKPKDTQVEDNKDVKEDGGNRTDEAQEGTNSSARSHDSNNLDFDLSSDSDSESGTGKPASLDCESQSRTHVTKESEQEGDVQEPFDEDVTKDGDSKGSCEVENSSDSAEHPGVVLPDPELGNGFLERREPETESQNSEQSGVTVGEELLDQSMEDEEEEEETDIDQDDHLIYLEEVLERIHAEYFARYETYLRKEMLEMPDIRRIVPELKSKTLEGTTVVFSGLYPTNYPMERTREFYHAKALGAKIGKSLILNSQDPNRTTHLVAARAGTEKVRQAQGCKHLHVVNPDWLWSCLERWERVEEQLYPLKEDYSRTPRSNSPAAFLDNQGCLQKAVFQPAPVHPRPRGGYSEARTYDSVTGKLIRRGPQAGRPSAYLQVSGPLSDRMDQSGLRGAAQGQQNEAAGSSQDDEQPGPSRRERQPSMSETMPLYTLCKEDLDSMDKEVDDILGEESDNESEGRGKEKPGNDDIAEEEEEEQHQQQPEAGESTTSGPPSKTDGVEERLQTTPPSDSSLSENTPRGQKRKHDDAGEEDDAGAKSKQGRRDSSDESSKDSNEEEEGSSSEADEMAAALEAELNDFM
ncbi:RNA polymerase II subunit A C-terminal domain phosphatase isoform X2 [Poeciliopsis prolifica]|uniref:RNA polymerase II subunit A C-terminal domain phosphatase isoform X2 n=1 Tax=Poeciliopsis prolifica TaxID=188132 RepID=UPI002414436D|nr:RNA polymerase II subunit A C-terminal domain phosphatase isoform X2 [Poeciliopsis prolifica]